MSPARETLTQDEVTVACGGDAFSPRPPVGAGVSRVDGRGELAAHEHDAAPDVRGEARARGLELGEHPADRRKRVVWIDRRSRVEDAGTNEGACFVDVEARAGTTGDVRSGRRGAVGAGQ